MAWKPDGTQLLTASGDKTCKLWDVETRSLVSEFNMGATVDDQQVRQAFNYTRRETNTETLTKMLLSLGQLSVARKPFTVRIPEWIYQLSRCRQS